MLTVACVRYAQSWTIYFLFLFGEESRKEWVNIITQQEQSHRSRRETKRGRYTSLAGSRQRKNGKTTSIHERGGFLSPVVNIVQAVGLTLPRFFVLFCPVTHAVAFSHKRRLPEIELPTLCYPCPPIDDSFESALFEAIFTRSSLSYNGNLEVSWHAAMSQHT